MLIFHDVNNPKYELNGIYVDDNSDGFFRHIPVDAKLLIGTDTRKLTITPVLPDDPIYDKLETGTLLYPAKITGKHRVMEDREPDYIVKHGKDYYDGYRDGFKYPDYRRIVMRDGWTRLKGEISPMDALSVIMAELGYYMDIAALTPFLKKVEEKAEAVRKGRIDEPTGMILTDGTVIIIMPVIYKEPYITHQNYTLV
jgi:hypothetical protein